MGFVANFRTRIPSLGHLWRRARQDPRYLSYDLLPIAATPRSRDFLARLAAARRSRTPGFTPSTRACAWHETLRGEGIVTDLPPLSASVTETIRRHFEATACRDPYRPHLGNFFFDRPASTETNMGYYALEDILAAPHVLDILNDPDVLQAAELYLGCKPLLDNIDCWWSFGGRSAPKGTQRYHRDLDSLRGFKHFIQLTAVGPDDGPHHFMAGTHRSPKLATGKAMPDDVIHATFGAANERVVTGPAGTRFLADTFGWHKGQLPQGGLRLILVAQYNVNRSPHLPRHPVMPAPGFDYDPEINRLILARA
jgi:hypothetical protein